MFTIIWFWNGVPNIECITTSCIFNCLNNWKRVSSHFPVYFLLNIFICINRLSKFKSPHDLITSLEGSGWMYSGWLLVVLLKQIRRESKWTIAARLSQLFWKILIVKQRELPSHDIQTLTDTQILIFHANSVLNIMACLFALSPVIGIVGHS